MVYKFNVKTDKQYQMKDITFEINKIVAGSGIKEGICMVYIPHTTAAVTINENADPDVTRDMLCEMDKIVPYSDNYRHFEGNSAAHIKSSMFGFSENIIIDNGSLLLGRWQGVYLCEFDGARNRTVYVKILKG